MILFDGFVSILSLMIFIRCKFTYLCWDILWFWWWIFILPATYLYLLSIVCNFATIFGLDTQNAEKNRLADFLVAPKGAKRFWISYYTISQYRTIRFWISYYTILNIVLYDFGYRTIRFWISFYTIWRIVTMDVRKLLMGWGEVFCRMEITPMMIPKQWAWIFCAETSVTPAVVVMFCRDLA